jgi:hypothetical protein
MEVQPRGTGKQVFPADKAFERKPVKKRKSKRLAETSSMTPDLNLPCSEWVTMVPPGFVSSRVNQLWELKKKFREIEIQKSC